MSRHSSGISGTAHPTGHHDDIVIAASLCAWGLDRMSSSKVMGFPAAIMDAPVVSEDDEKDYANMYDEDDRVVNWEEDL